MLDILVCEIPNQPIIYKPEVLKSLEVSLKYKDSGVSETINFQSYSVFKWIEEEVQVNKWKIKETIKDVTEVLTEGTSLESLNKYIENTNYQF